MSLLTVEVLLVLEIFAVLFLNWVVAISLTSKAQATSLTVGNLLTLVCKIHILHKQIIHIICHAEFRSHTYVLFKAYQIMNIYQLNKYVTGILMCKHNTGMLPNILYIYEYI